MLAQIDAAGKKNNILNEMFRALIDVMLICVSTS